MLYNHYWLYIVQNAIYNQYWLYIVLKFKRKFRRQRVNFLEPSGALQACNGTALPFYWIVTAFGLNDAHQNLQ